MQLESLTDGAFHPTSALGVLKGTFLSFIGGCVWFDVENERLVTPIPRYDFAFDGYRKMFTAEMMANLSLYASTITQRYENLPVLASPYASNYFHVTLECASALRLLGARHHAVAINPRLREFPYQDELLGRCLKGRTAVPVEDSAIHVDPILFYDYFSRESVDYVRECVDTFAQPGDDFIYLERKSSNRQRVEGIAETPEVLDVLGRYRFRRVDFGAGELTVSEQIRRMNGARTILAPHGAALTNIVYLNPPVNLIEVFPPYLATHDCYGEICRILGFSYHPIVVTRHDEDGNMIIDAGELDRILQTCR
ncbi:glycosyltransferase family 61 protein [Azospirillum sp.]|uniref:glycosyltransferase family 61 protein n=1 Tax=Azospirillum sp. TaxID=34012 RepID=UPI003D72B0D9